jgi:hypothetical protein
MRIFLPFGGFPGLMQKTFANFSYKKGVPRGRVLPLTGQPVRIPPQLP